MKLSKFKVFGILKSKNYLAIFLISSLIILASFPILQSLVTGGLHNLNLWFAVTPKYNVFLLVIFSILFGLLLSLQVYNLKIKVCNIKNKTVSATAGGLGTFITFLVPACPACLSILSLLLPGAYALYITQFFIKFNTLLLLFGTFLLILGLWILGGFKKY